jgi:alkaline phosphatase D
VDGFIFLGDNVYGDTPSGKLSKMKAAYKIQQTKLPQWLMRKKEILAIWDDHDFGINDGGGDYPFKKEAQKLFLEFWKIPSLIQEGTEKVFILNKLNKLRILR